MHLVSNWFLELAIIVMIFTVPFLVAEEKQHSESAIVPPLHQQIPILSGKMVRNETVRVRQRLVRMLVFVVFPAVTGFDALPRSTIFSADVAKTSAGLCAIVLSGMDRCGMEWFRPISAPWASW